MSKFTQIAIAAAISTTILGGAITTSQAAGMMNLAPVASEATVINAGYYNRGYNNHGYRHYGHKRHYKRHYSYNYGHRHCFWKKRKVWSNYYGYFIVKKFKVCR